MHEIYLKEDQIITNTISGEKKQKITPRRHLEEEV
jgi:hypothetical protein